MTSIEELRKFSEKFCSKDAEITFKSSDNVFFKIHLINLKACSEGFSPPESSTFLETVALTEPASILEPLFQFIYPMPNPDLVVLDFQTLEALAEAAEKYQVYPAMGLCRIHMLQTLPKHALPVLAYATKHDYPEIMAKAAPLVLNEPLHDIVEKLPQESVKAWCHYYNHWMNAYRNALRLCPDESNLSTCDISVIKRFGEGFRSLQDISGTFSDASGGIAINSWLSSIEADVNKIPSFVDIALGQSPSGPPSTLLEQISIESGQGLKVSSTFGDCDGSQFQSCDGVLFQIDNRFLKALTQNFPPTSESSIFQPLTEDSSTLHLLFHFLYPLPQPDTQILDFECMERLADAAEKYRVYTAMNVCRIYMKKTLPQHASNIFAYATKYKYLDIMDMAGSLVISLPLSETAVMIPQDSLVPWMRYYNQWNHILQTAIGLVPTLPTPIPRCSNCGRNLRHGSGRGPLVDICRFDILVRLSTGLSSLKNLDETFKLHSDCARGVHDEILGWRAAVEKEIEKIGSFSSCF